MSPDAGAQVVPASSRTLFVFILVTNMIGYIPLPINSGEKFTIFGAHIPSFQLYAADTNVAFPLILALVVFIAFNYEGVKYHGFVGYFKSLIPAWNRQGPAAADRLIEVLSIFLRLMSLTVRLWANLLAGHLLIAFMGGELGVLVGRRPSPGLCSRSASPSTCSRPC